MIGRVDPEHKKKPNYIYVIGADRLSTGLDAAVTKANKNLIDFKLDSEFEIQIYYIVIQLQLKFQLPLKILKL